MASAVKRNYYKEKMNRRKEEKKEEPELPKYRDRAKERREDQNPDYEPTELGSFHAVAPPGAVVLRSADANKISIENSKYLGGDVEHTHLVKGLDYALLQKIRSEIDTKKPETEEAKDGKSSKVAREDQLLSFRTAAAKSVYQWIVKPLSVVKANEMFLPGRMAFVFNMEEGSSHDIPTTLHRSKADCPIPEEMVTVGVDGSVLDRIAKIMSYLRLGSSGKVLKKKKKDRDARGKLSGLGIDFEEDEKARLPESGVKKHEEAERESLPPPPQMSHLDVRDRQAPPSAREDDDDIFVGYGVDYAVPGNGPNQSPCQRTWRSPPGTGSGSHISLSPPMNGYDVIQQAQVVAAAAAAYQGEWQQQQQQGWQYAEQQQAEYPEQYLQQQQRGQGPGLGSVFKRDDQRLQQLREKDAREKDPNFVSESYSECYPGYQEYNREIVESDDEDDLSKMDMGGRAKGRLHRWDFETEEEWATYNEQKEAMPKAAFQFGVKMQDGRKTRKQNKDQKLTNELHKINRILARKKAEKEGRDDAAGDFDDEPQPGKKLRV
ncbi:unnamed protein product [Spirodela intermedia]|uniref:Uncharacterized protein n=1 Tax=Spirodela intermedia TaxID=51605 RepID=A0A7I8J5C2_SPIIN|nr:unnamed protein product [Spirodela intermedia]CAA6664592.1 unnamed protein product [Spirodela intermedia]